MLGDSWRGADDMYLTGFFFFFFYILAFYFVLGYSGLTNNVVIVSGEY